MCAATASLRCWAKVQKSYHRRQSVHISHLYIHTDTYIYIYIISILGSQVWNRILEVSWLERPAEPLIATILCIWHLLIRYNSLLVQFHPRPPIFIEKKVSTFMLKYQDSRKARVFYRKAERNATYLSQVGFISMNCGTILGAGYSEMDSSCENAFLAIVFALERSWYTTDSIRSKLTNNKGVSSIRNKSHFILTNLIYVIVYISIIMIILSQHNSVEWGVQET